MKISCLRRPRIRAFRVLLALWPLAACACSSSSWVQGAPSHSPDTLIALVEDRADVSPAPTAATADILRVDSAMRAFVAQRVNRHASAIDRLESLLEAMIDEGLLELTYNHQRTQTAAETFHSRTGNCLSFTNLFVALARESGLTVSFQLVKIPPSWNFENNWMILDQHINALVSDFGVRNAVRRDYVVDFNIPDYQGQFPRTAIPDDDAFALFFSNRSAELLQIGDYRSAYRAQRLALRLSQEQEGVWINLAALFAATDHETEAMSALSIASIINPSNPATLANLAQLYRRQGLPEQAEAIQQRLQSVNERNPYFHFQQARQAFTKGDTSVAKAAVEQALSLKNDDHRFFHLQAQIELAYGNASLAQKSLQKAAELTKSEEAGLRYEEKLRLLKKNAP